MQLMYQGELCLTFFSAVVKNVASPNMEIKKLVYIYLLHHAEAEPDVALLSINAIQKSLSDPNPLARAMALRTMSGIRVPVISQIVVLAIKRGTSDMSPHVRKAAALAIPKCYRLQPSTLPQIVDFLGVLLGDQQYFVVGPAAAAFLEVCPDRIDLIHKNYRSIVKKLVDMDEWSQIATMRMMLIYARRCFPRRTERVKVAAQREFYDDEQENAQDKTDEIVPVLDPDLELFLQTCKSLLHSRNSAVIVGVARCFLYLGTPSYLEAAVGPLVAMLRGSEATQQIILHDIIFVASKMPQAFTKYASHFLLKTTETPQIWRLKLNFLTIIFPHCGKYIKDIILSELSHFCGTSNPDLVRASVRTIGRCALSDPSASPRCLVILLRLVSSTDENLVSESLTVIRYLVQQDPPSHRLTVIMLARNLDTMTSPGARATIIWLVGEFAGVDYERNIAPDVLRILAKGFADETVTVKQQIVLLGAKVYLHHLRHKITAQSALQAGLPGQEEVQKKGKEKQEEEPENLQAEANQEEKEKAPEQPDRITILWQYILLLTRYDTCYDLRDRARLYKALLSPPLSDPPKLAEWMLLAAKPVPNTSAPDDPDFADLTATSASAGSSALDGSGGNDRWLLGSASQIVGARTGIHGLRGYEELPDWVADGEQPDPKLRDVPPETGGGGSSGGGGGSGTAAAMLDRALREHERAMKEKGKGKEVAWDSAVGPSAGAQRKEMSFEDWLEQSEGEDESEEEEEGEEEEGDDGDDDDDDKDDDEEETEDSESEESTDEEASSGDESDSDNAAETSKLVSAPDADKQKSN